MFRTLRFKRCKRCGGNLYLECDEHGFYVSCIQCGAVYEKFVEWGIKRSNSKLVVATGSSHH